MSEGLGHAPKALDLMARPEADRAGGDDASGGAAQDGTGRAGEPGNVWRRSEAHR